MQRAAKAIHGIKWNYAATAVQTAAQIVFVAVVARLLDPAAFGVMALAMVVVRFGNYLSGAGIRFYLIQKKDLTDADIRAAFVLTAATGALLSAAAFLLAPPAAALFDAPQIDPVLRVLALSFIVQGLAVPSAALLQRSLRFRALAVIETTAYLVGYIIVGLLLAARGFGVWSLVGAALSQQALVLLMSFAAAPHRIGLAFGADALAEVAVKGSHFALNTVLDYCVIAAPTLIVGRFFGTAELGIYNRAATLITLPTHTVSAAVSRVALPYISPLQSDPVRLARVFSQWATLSALIFLPMCLGMAAAAPDIVLLVLGPRWLAAVPVFQVLAVATAMHLVTVQLGTCADAVRKLNVRTTLSLATLSVTAAAMLLLAEHGLAAAAAGVAIGEALRLVLHLWMQMRWFGFPARALLAIYTPGITAALSAAASVALVHGLLRGAPALVAVGTEAAAGAATVAAVALLYPAPAFKEALRALLDQLFGARRVPVLSTALRLARLQ